MYRISLLYSTTCYQVQKSNKGNKVLETINSKNVPDFYTGTIYSIEDLQSFKKNFICN